MAPTKARDTLGHQVKSLSMVVLWHPQSTQQATNLAQYLAFGPGWPRLFGHRSPT